MQKAPMIIKKIVRVVPYTHNLSEDRIEPTTNMNAEFTGIEVEVVFPFDDTEVLVILLPTRGPNKCEGMEMLVDLL